MGNGVPKTRGRPIPLNGPRHWSTFTATGPVPYPKYRVGPTITARPMRMGNTFWPDRTLFPRPCLYRKGKRNSIIDPCPDKTYKAHSPGWAFYCPVFFVRI